MILRGDELILSGSPEAVEEVVPVAKRMVRQARLHEPLDVGDVERYYQEATDGESPSEFEAPSDGGEDASVTLPQAGKLIQPKSEGQHRYLRAMRDNDVTVGIGPAGTGKTYLAVAKAVAALHRKRVRKIILTRPAVEAGEELGFLPGDIREKVDPYLRPLYDALGDMMQRDQMQRAIEEETVEIAPLAYMRGRTLSDAFLILDEAQNATTAQMKMFLTRLGLNSQVVITGDKTQIDLSHPGASGLIEIEELLRGIDGIEFVYLSETDVVRHRLVKEIIRAYRDQDDGDGPS